MVFKGSRLEARSSVKDREGRYARLYIAAGLAELLFFAKEPFHDLASESGVLTQRGALPFL